MKEFFSNKKNLIICGSVLAVVIVAVVLTIVFGTSTTRKKVELENELKELGKDFYENFYYDLVVKDNGIEQISRFADIGIKVDLANLGRYKNENAEKVEKFVNPKTNEKCNSENTKVKIYPEDPYEKTNYRIEVEIDCGLE